MSVWEKIVGCQCPPFWHGILPPPCPVHNPQRVSATQTVVMLPKDFGVITVEQRKILQNAIKKGTGKMKFLNDVERKAWFDYVHFTMPVKEEDDTPTFRRGRLTEICEEADWMVEEMRRRG